VKEKESNPSFKMPTCFENTKINVYEGFPSKSEETMYEDKSSLSSSQNEASNSFGPMFKDRDHFVSMHFA
jgi:hypothetical protein